MREGFANRNLSLSLSLTHSLTHSCLILSSPGEFFGSKSGKGAVVTGADRFKKGELETHLAVIHMLTASSLFGLGNSKNQSKFHRDLDSRDEDGRPTHKIILLTGTHSLTSPRIAHYS